MHYDKPEYEIFTVSFILCCNYDLYVHYLGMKILINGKILNES